MDQAPYRKAPPGTIVSEEFMAEWRRIVRDNADWLRAVIRERGWPGRSLVGSDGAQVAWLIAQHASHDPAFQRDCRDLLEQAVARGQASPRNLAYLTDRVLLNEHGRQRYGTQFTTGPDGGPEPFPLEDPGRVDELRAGMGLEPLAEYAKRFPAQPPPDPWLARLDRELEWWRTFLHERLQDDPEYLERFHPDRHLQPHIARLLPPDRAPEQVRILDCAAGPATALGRVWRGGRVQLVAIDALAEPYHQILEQLALQPPVPSSPGMVEQLDGRFAAASFDLVYMRNALDHCRDPRLALDQMLKVARPGGVVLIEHYNQDPRPLIPASLPGASIEADYSEGRMAVVIRRR